MASVMGNWTATQHFSSVTPDDSCMSVQSPYSASLSAKLIAAQHAGRMAACRLSNRNRRRIRPTVCLFASAPVFVLLVFGTCCLLLRSMLRSEQVPWDVSCGAASHTPHREPAAGHDIQPDKVCKTSVCSACSMWPLRCPQFFSQKIGATSVIWHSPAMQCKVSCHRCDA